MLSTKLVQLCQQAQRPAERVTSTDALRESLEAKEAALGPLRGFLATLTDEELMRLEGLMYFGRDCSNGNSEDLRETTRSVWQGRESALLSFEDKNAFNIESYFAAAFTNLAKNG
ncbi:hypothetical protein [Xanthomonas arboricola]|uniref:Uncharacterized protein n=1 Tax=Xanthomonas arboricola TaxID=56448 RepID=A0AB73H3U7_9XANT|nr:hypothetical protein [Xanthomonas arboricola]MBB5672348.1 hypothetical protein [Xanthomonas arboricola]